MNLKFYKNDDKLIVNLIGELDHHSSEEVRIKIDDRIERDNIKNIILDFSNVTFMDSSGIGVVVGRYKKVLAKGGNVCVVKLRSGLRKIFELSGLFKIIKSYNDVEEALKHI